MQLTRRKLLSGAVGAAAAAVGGASYWAYGSAGAASSQVPVPKSLGTLSSGGNFVSGAGLAFSPDGRELAVLASTSVQRWDTASWNEQPALLAGTGLVSPQAFAYSPDGDCVAISYGTSLDLADRRDGSLLQSVSMTSTGSGQGAGSIGQVAFSPDNRYLAVVVGAADISVYPYSRGRVGETPAVRLTLDSSEPVGPMGFSAASSKLYASGTGAGVTFWDLGSWNRGQLPAGTSATGQQPSESSFMVLSQDGRFIASGQDPVVIWDTTSGRVADIINDVPDGGGVGGAFASDSSLVIGGQSGDLSLWDFADRKTLAAWSVGNPPLVSVAVSPTGGVVAIGCQGTCSIWNLPAHLA